VSSEAYIKFLRKGFHGERLQSLKSDSLRWRWWRLYCLSDQEVFPGLVAKGLSPRPEMEIVGEVYQTSEFKEHERIEYWRREKTELVNSGLIKVANVNSHEFIWNVDFHSFQDRYSKKGAQLKDKFYSSFLNLNDRDKSVFIVLLSKFNPSNVDLEVFSIPKSIAQFEAYANKTLPLFGRENKEDPGAIKKLLIKVTDDVRGYEIKRKTERGNSDVREFISWYCDRFKQETKKPYSVGGKDFKLVSEMLKLFSLEELRKMAERFFREPDQYVKRAGYTIGVFKVMLNRLVSVKERKPIGLGDFSKWR
jgi:hypothetical protein